MPIRNSICGERTARSDLFGKQRAFDTAREGGERRVGGIAHTCLDNTLLVGASAGVNRQKSRSYAAHRPACDKHK